MPGGPLNLNSTNLPRPWSPRESSPSGIRTRDLMVSSQRLGPLDHEAVHIHCIVQEICKYEIESIFLNHALCVCVCVCVCVYTHTHTYECIRCLKCRCQTHERATLSV